MLIPSILVYQCTCTTWSDMHAYINEIECVNLTNCIIAIAVYIYPEPSICWWLIYWCWWYAWFALSTQLILEIFFLAPYCLTISNKYWRRYDVSICPGHLVIVLIVVSVHHGNSNVFCINSNHNMVNFDSIKTTCCIHHVIHLIQIWVGNLA
jgi:hypothetical protein